MCVIIKTLVSIYREHIVEDGEYQAFKNIKAVIRHFFQIVGIKVSKDLTTTYVTA